ncbi:MAG: hypothetical protein IIB87_07690 [Chloroflexi bacterium]|nr:hypothetical protein [Chloroflexota bacterium]
MSSRSRGRGALERALARLRRRPARDNTALRQAQDPALRQAQTEEPATGLSQAAFRAVVEERLRGLDRQLDEVKGRVNGLLFLLAGSVAAQIVLGLAK